MSAGKCPECDAEIAIANDAEKGEILTCSDCGSELELKSLEPVVLEEAPQEEEDWGE